MKSPDDTIQITPLEKNLHKILFISYDFALKHLMIYVSVISFFSFLPTLSSERFRGVNYT